MAMCVRTRRLCKQRHIREGVALAVLLVINHLVAQYPLTLALFDLDRSKMVVLK